MLLIHSLWKDAGRAKCSTVHVELGTLVGRNAHPFAPVPGRLSGRAKCSSFRASSRSGEMLVLFRGRARVGLNAHREHRRWCVRKVGRDAQLRAKTCEDWRLSRSRSAEMLAAAGSTRTVGGTLTRQERVCCQVGRNAQQNGHTNFAAPDGRAKCSVKHSQSADQMHQTVAKSR